MANRGLKWLKAAKLELKGVPPVRKTRRRGVPVHAAHQGPMLAEAARREGRSDLRAEDGLEIIAPLEGACFDCLDTRQAVAATRHRHELLKEE